MAELHIQIYFNYLKMCFDNAFEHYLGIDLLGNAIYSEGLPSKLSEASFLLKSLSPANFQSTFFFNKSLSPNCYLKTDLASFSIKQAPKTIENYLDFAACIFSPEKEAVIINFVEGGQFWGEALGSRLLDGKMYTNDSDFNTVCHKDTYNGRLSVTSKNFKYEGFFQDSMPHYFGRYYLNNSLIYEGDLRRGNAL
jgi:hypothetical protein